MRNKYSRLFEGDELVKVAGILDETYRPEELQTMLEACAIVAVRHTITPLDAARAWGVVAELADNGLNLGTYTWEQVRDALVANGCRGAEDCPPTKGGPRG